jgi:diguanylate cyclase (GGDEF)-like protein/PAS domain S-box-containing protein
MEHYVFGSYDPRLVVLSVLIAVLASYAALDLAGRVTAARGVVRRLWFSGGAIAMGTGIWSMHYVGMLAFRLPVPVLYDWPTVLVSLLAAILASATALYVVSRKSMGPAQAIAGSICMGSGIAGMHYIGMAAMRLPAMCHYSKPEVAASVVLAILISLVALLLTFHFRGETASGGWRKAVSAMVMGAAIPAMHYTGMAAASFTAPAAMHENMSHALTISSLGIVGIVSVTILLLGFTVTTALLDRRFASEVEESKTLVTLLLEFAPEAIYGIDKKGAYTFCNHAFLKLTGYGSFTDLQGKNVHDVIHHTKPDGTPYPVEECRIYEAFRRGKGTHVDSEVLWRKDGTSFPAEYWSHPLLRDGQLIVSVVTFVDISDRKRVESKLVSLTERLSLATAVAKVGVWDWDVTSNVFTWDGTMFEIYGLPAAPATPYEKWSAAVHPEDLPAIEATLRKVICEKGQGASEFRIVLANGAVRNISSAERVVLDDSAEVSRVIGVNMDITERKGTEEALRDSEAQMAHSAQHDFLTGLPNRLLLNDRVGQAIAVAPRHMKKIGVLFLDLDGFKHINDSLGHPIGDQLLRSVAKRLMDCVRGTDTVSRQGGDEFVVLLSEMERPEDAAITARRILQTVAEAHSIDQHDLHITACIGISVYPDDGLDAETLIKNADTAMYQVKENGRRNYQFFKPAMNVRAVARQSIEEDLRSALEHQDFALHYQPKINLRTGDITGAEALLRWMHPTRGPVSPAEFIPVAEDSGLILPIGRWVLREACMQAKAWVDAGLALGSIAVNVSAMEFRNENFLEGLFATLAETGLDPRSLELELTESVLMKRAESTESILQTLRARGVRLAVDDFGTGYSSLSYLRKFPINALKIDQSFVRQITTTPDETTIVTAVISMGRSLNLRVIAEGVETQEELAFLQAHQCDEAQGYYFSRPVVGEQFAELLKTGVLQTVLK